MVFAISPFTFFFFFYSFSSIGHCLFITVYFIFQVSKKQLAQEKLKKSSRAPPMSPCKSYSPHEKGIFNAILPLGVDNKFRSQASLARC